jgi:hypothetical protein
MTQPLSADALMYLTEQDRQRLYIFKQCYVLQADGFSAAQAARLCFIRWLYVKGRLIA